MGKTRDHRTERKRRHKETEEGKSIKKKRRKTRHKETGKARQKGGKGGQARQDETHQDEKSETRKEKK
jgi:hypothetical protein